MLVSRSLLRQVDWNIVLRYVGLRYEYKVFHAQLERTNDNRALLVWTLWEQTPNYKLRLKQDILPCGFPRNLKIEGIYKQYGDVLID